MKPILIAVAALYAAVIASTVGLAEGSAEQFYKSRFFLSGLLARGAGVCGGDWKRTLKIALELVKTAELRAISNAYPKTVEQWGLEGAAAFNNGVMTEGIGPTCAYLATVCRDAEAIVRGH